MRDRKISLIYIIYYILVILPIYKDSPLSLYLGVAGYTLLMPLSIILFLLVVVLGQNGRVKKYQETNGLFLLGIWLIVVSAIGIIIWCLMGKPITVVGEFLPTKALKVWLQYMSYPMYVYILTFCIKRMRRVSQIFVPIFHTLIVLTIIDVIELTQMPNAFSSIHFAGVLPYHRVRLLTTESSWTAMLVYVYAALSLYYGWAYKKKAVFVSSAVCTMILIAGTGSKTLLTSIPIVLIIYVMSMRKKMNAKTIFGLLFVAVSGLLFIYNLLPSLISSFSADISHYTSVATRLYTTAIGLGIGIIIPTGVGGGIYLGVLQETLKKFLPVFQKLPIRFNTSEILGLISQNTDKALTVKSGIFHFNMYWGIIGTVCLFYIFYIALKHFKESMAPCNELMRTIFYGALVMITALNFDFEFWLLFAVMYGVSNTTIKCNLKQAF